MRCLSLEGQLEHHVGGHEPNSISTARKGRQAEVVPRSQSDSHILIMNAKRCGQPLRRSSRSLLTPGAVLTAIVCQSVLCAGAAWGCTEQAEAWWLQTCRTQQSDMVDRLQHCPGARSLHTLASSQFTDAKDLRTARAS